MAKNAIDSLREMSDAIAKAGGAYVEDDLKDIEKYTQCFVTYVQRVYDHIRLEPVYRRLYEGQAYRDKMTALDEKRTIAHNAAIDACNKLNRWCVQLGVEPFCETETDDRRKVGEFCIRFVNEIYAARYQA